jgi:hypothetical protein
VARGEDELARGGGGRAHRWRLRGVAAEEQRCMTVERQSRGGIGFVKKKKEFGFLPWSRQ